MSVKKFADFAKKKLTEKGEEIPDVVRVAARALEDYEKTFGTEAVYKLVEKTCMEEIEKDGSTDKGYAEYLLNFLHEMKREAALQSSN